MESQDHTNYMMDFVNINCLHPRENIDIERWILIFIQLNLSDDYMFIYKWLTKRRGQQKKKSEYEEKIITYNYDENLNYANSLTDVI